MISQWERKLVLSSYILVLLDKHSWDSSLLVALVALVSVCCSPGQWPCCPLYYINVNNSQTNDKCMIIYSKWNQVCPEDRLHKWKLMLTRVWGRSINNWILLLQQKLSYANYMQMCPHKPYGGAPRESGKQEPLARLCTVTSPSVAALRHQLPSCDKTPLTGSLGILKIQDSSSLVSVHK